MIKPKKENPYLARYRELKALLGFTQTKIAKLTGYHRRTVNRWEHAIYPLPYVVIGLLEQLAKKIDEKEGGDHTDSN